MYLVLACLIFLQAEGVHEHEIHRRLQGDYGPNALRGKEVHVLCQNFKDGRTDLKNDPKKKPVRSRTSRTNGNSSKVGFAFIRISKEIFGVKKFCRSRGFATTHYSGILRAT